MACGPLIAKLFDASAEATVMATYFGLEKAFFACVANHRRQWSLFASRCRKIYGLRMSNRECHACSQVNRKCSGSDATSFPRCKTNLDVIRTQGFVETNEHVGCLEKWGGITSVGKKPCITEPFAAQRRRLGVHKLGGSVTFFSCAHQDF